MWYIHTIKYYSALQKMAGDSAICDNIGECGEYYAKWDKPGTEGGILYDTTDMRNLK